MTEGLNKLTNSPGFNKSQMPFPQPSGHTTAWVRTGEAFRAVPTGIRWTVALALLDIFFTFSRVLESHNIGIGPLSLAMACRGAVFLAALFSGQLMRILRSPISKGMLLFTFWLMVSTLFSSWKGGSVNLLLHVWFPSLVAFFGINGLLERTKDVQRAIYTIGFASLTILITSFFTSSTASPRFDLGSGTLGNSNDLAQLLLIGLPGILLFIGLNKGRKYIFRLLLLLAIPYMLKVAASTASRAGMLTLMLYGAMIFWSASGLNRLKVGLIVTTIAILFFATAPRSTIMRYATILPFISADPADEESATIKDAAEGSSEQRRALLEQSLKMTIYHPLFGVGPGTYESAAADLSKEERLPAMWHGSHNTFTQVSAESGIPGVIMYVVMLFAAFVGVWRVRKLTASIPAMDDVHRVSLAMLMILSCFTLNAFFASLAYLTTFPMLAAMAEALLRATKREIAALERSRLPVTPTPASAKTPLRLRATPA
jgi:O-antigen ligase